MIRAEEKPVVSESEVRFYSDVRFWVGLAVFFVWFAIGLKFHNDYGGFTDELVEIQTAAVNVKYIFSKIPALASVESLPLPAYGDFRELPELLTYKDRVYGVTALLPTLFVNYLPGVSLDLRAYLNFRRLYIFGTVFFAAICFYLFLRKRYPNSWTPIIGLLMMIASPRFFAESFYNSKDIVFYAWFLITLCCCGWYTIARSRRAVACFCLAFALTANARYFGAGLLPAFMTLIAVSEWAAGRSIRATLRLEILTLIGALGSFYFVSPYLWEFNLDSIISGLTFVTNLPGVGDSELFLGRFVAPRDVPYYLAVWIAITTPLVCLGFFLIGSFKSLFALFHSRTLRRLAREDIFGVFNFGLIAVYYALIVLSKATIYHGWRHAYFLYAPMLLLMAVGFDWLIRRVPAYPFRGCVFALCAVSFFLTGNWILKNHPLDFAYFNQIGRPIASRFSRDSWGVGSRPCILYLANAIGKDVIDFGVNEDLTWGASEFTLWALPESVSERFHIVWQTEHADAFCYSYKNHPGNDYARPGFRLLKTFYVDEYAVAGAYERIKE